MPPSFMFQSECSKPLRALSVSGSEGMSTLFRFSASLSSPEAGIKPEDILGKGVSFVLNEGPKPLAKHGIITSFLSSGLISAKEGKPLYGYTIQIEPTFALLRKTQRSRIFQKKSLEDITKEILGDYGYSDIEFKLSSPLKPYEYTVQYQESDFDFLMRRFSKEGLGYWFKQSKDKHVLVIADAPSAYADGTPKNLVYTTQPNPTAVMAFEAQHGLAPSKVFIGSSNFETPGAGDMRSDAEDGKALPLEKALWVDRFDFKKDKGETKASAEKRVKQARQESTIFTGTCNIPLEIGGKHAIKTMKGEEVGAPLVIVSHTFGIQLPSHNEAGHIDRLHFAFSAIPEDRLRAIGPISSKGRISGYQPALVTGPSGEQIHTDKFGRVKVRFFWNSDAKGDDTSSTWVRVMTPSAGNDRGFFSLPRVNDEVMVGFVDGDPDWPYVAGSLFHGENTWAYPLPGEKTKSGFRSQTYKGTGYNQLVFDDKNGAENIELFAQRDHSIQVKHNKTEKVTVNRTTEIGGEEKLKVKKDQTIEIDGKSTLLVKGLRSEEIKEKSSLLAKEILIEGKTKICLKVGSSSITIEGSKIVLDSPKIEGAKELALG